MTTHATVPAGPPRAQYTADGYQTAFPFPFPVLKAADLEVFVDVARQVSGYTLEGLGDSAGGAVLFAAPPAAGAAVTLRRKLTIARLSDFQEGGAFRAKVINDELDFQTMALQELETELARAVRLAPTAPDGLEVALPPAVPGKAIGWSSDGQRLVNDPSDFTTTVAIVQQWATDADGALQQAADAAGAASASAVEAGQGAAEAAQSAEAAAVSRGLCQSAAAEAGAAAEAAERARLQAEAQAAAAAFDAFALRADRAAVQASAAAAAESADHAAVRAMEALARLERVDLSLWRAERAAQTAESAARRATAAHPLTLGITPGAVLPNWARNKS